MKDSNEFYGIRLPKEIQCTKSNVLKFLRKKIKLSKIEKILDFTVLEWENNKMSILRSISKNFDSEEIIVRSSAIGEDSHERSDAGIYESVLNVDSTSKIKLKKAIETVVKSYKKNSNENPENQILIQKQSKNIVTSGVVFLRSPDIGAPYYTINYDEGSSTDSVTKGYVGNSLKIFRKINPIDIPKKWKRLINSLKEIENILGTDLLDIEFGMTIYDVVIFQVRFLTSVKRPDIVGLEKKISKLISKNKKQFLKLNKPTHVSGKFTVFSDMCDWNPAEIIGNNPNVLDYSLYDYLIMKKTWHRGRTKLGYQDVNPYPLMTKFGNKPYVDVRASFNSLIPQSIKKRLKHKLMNFYLNKLLIKPHLHDKVEFEILFTCYDTTESRLNDLKNYGFTVKEINEIKNNLLSFTNNILESFPIWKKTSENSIEQLKQKRIEIKSRISNFKNHKELLTAAELLLKDCKKFGTYTFSSVARIAFIGTILLHDLKKRNYVSSQFVEKFMNSINSPLSEIQSDFNTFQKKQISKKEFLNKYGHLRPGTYDLTAMRYDKENKFLDNIKFLKTQNQINIIIPNESLSPIFNKHQLKLKVNEFFNFVKEALVLREKLKFEFSVNLSDALELIAEAGFLLGFSRQELANLDIQTIFKLKNKDKKTLKQVWNRKIIKNKEEKDLNNYLINPPIIFSTKDFSIIQHYYSKPNFITTKKLTKDIIILNNLQGNYPNLENKIVVIENADPGYDWIFTKNPAGLITKYGGIASHMAIRCAELKLPAAIGCGEVLFEKITSATKVLLDCQNEHIINLVSKKSDEYMEAKKILKSIGYIK